MSERKSGKMGPVDVADLDAALYFLSRFFEDEVSEVPYV
jgi:hypothetical protein